MCEWWTHAYVYVGVGAVFGSCDEKCVECNATEESPMYLILDIYLDILDICQGVSD